MQGTLSWMAQMNQNGVAAQMGSNSNMLPNHQQVLDMQHASAQLKTQMQTRSPTSLPLPLSHSLMHPSRAQARHHNRIRPSCSSASRRRHSRRAGVASGWA